MTSTVLRCTPDPGRRPVRGHNTFYEIASDGLFHGSPRATVLRG